ncbi:hypothetical protein [Streptomyces inhibens]|uniref:hypothetical protein n=1 Tax=Streptomyces inhibens TaxID=2293571 RepID=UPI0015F24AF6|nr:hypothetical protein [Streptomyces inhibens]
MTVLEAGSGAEQGDEVGGSGERAPAGLRVLGGGGAVSRRRDALPHRRDEVLAERLGIGPVAAFPGEHAGYPTHAAEFAARPTDTLAAYHQ